MRLTLRTMLAYLDDILEPDDTEDIGKKIEESEFATNLVHRTRDCMRRLRLGVPALIGRGLGNDPNSVAEYLDNTLSDDRVPEFEKVCLESDVHLAEVASCHQILTIVLGEPAEIDPEMRRRMYQVPAQIDAPPIQADAVGAPSRTTPPPVQPGRRPKPEIPAYLLEPPSRFWPLAALVVISALLTCGGVLLFGPVQWRERAVALFQATPADEAEQATEQVEKTPETPDESAAATSPTEAAGSPAAAPSDVPAADAEQDSPAEAPQTGPPAQPSGLLPPKRGADDDLGAPPAPDPEDNPEAMPEAAAATTVEPPLPGPRPQDPRRAGTTPPAAPDEAPPEDNPLIDSPPDLSDRPGAVPAPDRTAPAESFGRYTSKHEVLLRADAAGEWKRLPPMSPLSKGDRLLSLPLFKPTISLTSNITIQAEGPALIHLVGWTEEGVPIIDVEFGRLTLSTIGKAGNPLQIKLDEEQPQLTFVDAESTLALDVRRVLPAGKDPEAAPGPLACDVYVMSGLVRVQGAGGTTMELQAPERKGLTTATPEVAGKDFPKWVTSEALTDLERLAVSTLEPQLTPDRAVLPMLQDLKLFENRRREVRSLAIRCAATIGYFDPAVAALNDPAEKITWPIYVEELRAAVARDPETAAEVRAAFTKQRNADAPALYRMLWGYSNEDLKGGQDVRLVDGLDHTSLDYRVLSFWNLQNLTGSNHGYHAGDPTAKRRAAVNVWKEKRRQGKIVARVAASLPAAKPPAAKATER